MIRSELIRLIASENPHLTAQQAERLVGCIFETITDAMAHGNRVELRGFGVFSVRKREARIGRNPRNGVTVSVQNKTVPFFTAGKQIRDRLNGR